MGGPVAIEAALQLGSRVRAVVGVDTFKNIGLPPPDAQQTEARLQFFAADFSGATTVFVSQSFFREDADPALKTKIAADMAAGDPAVGIAAIRGLNDWDGVTALQRLSQQSTNPLPILAINAKHGAPSDLGRLQGIYANFDLREMDGVGHFLMMEQPTEFNELLLREIALLTQEAAL
jgi:pimeloyl-ACP methyl ester carboxylesterase